MGARPDALRPCSRSSSQIMAKASLPTPFMFGSTTVSVIAAARAASTALPPRRRASMPAAVASGWEAATALAANTWRAAGGVREGPIGHRSNSSRGPATLGGGGIRDKPDGARYRQAVYRDHATPGGAWGVGRAWVGSRQLSAAIALAYAGRAAQRSPYSRNTGESGSTSNLSMIFTLEPTMMSAALNPVAEQPWAGLPQSRSPASPPWRRSRPSRGRVGSARRPGTVRPMRVP